jgi:competence protein ComEC
LFWEYQRHKFLLTGDLEKSGEKKLLNYILPQKINLFQVAHHGSNSSTSDEFLKIISPETCIISTKKN